MTKSKAESTLSPRVVAVASKVVKTPHGEFLSGPLTDSYLFESACSAKITDLAKRMDSGDTLRTAAAADIRALINELAADLTDKSCYGGRSATLAQLASIGGALEGGASLAYSIQRLETLVQERYFGVSGILLNAQRAPHHTDVPAYRPGSGETATRPRNQWSV